MTNTDAMLTRPERSLAGGLVALLLAAGITAGTAAEPAGTTSATTATSAQSSSPAPSPDINIDIAPAPLPPEPVPAPDVLPPPPLAPAPQAQAAGPIPAPPEPPQAGCPVPKRAGPRAPAKVLPPPAVADADLPAPLAAGPKASNLDAVAGKGIWVTNWPDTQVDVAGIVARTKAAGLRSIWVRTGGSRQGYYGERVLPALVPAAHEAGLHVVAWDFPFLSDPVGDAQRAKAALDFGIDAFAPDVETSAEGTYATEQRVALYLSLVRSFAGTRPIAATVPRPTELRRKTFPYKAFPAYADLFVPMVYWSCNEPGALVEQSLLELGQLLPVAPAGQGYNMGSEGGRHGLPTRAETWRFLDVAKRGGAVGASLWTLEKVSADQFAALTDYPWDVTPR